MSAYINNNTMATKKTSAIDDKKTQKGKKSPPSENNWGAFFASLITNFIFILLIYIIGSNFIYLSDTKYAGLKYLFPDEIDNYLNPQQYGGGGGLTLPADEATIKKLSIIGCRWFLILEIVFLNFITIFNCFIITIWYSCS